MLANYINGLSKLRSLESLSSDEIESLLSKEHEGLEPSNNEGRGVTFIHDGADLGDGGEDAEARDASKSGQVSKNGIHVLAWYEPFHLYSYGYSYRWGIFIRNSSIEYLARFLRLGGVDASSSFNQAAQFLYSHELGHFEFEFLSANAEVSSSKAFYLKDLHSLKSKSPDFSLEAEGLFTQLALESLDKASKAVLAPWASGLPLGYRDFKSHSKSKRAASWSRVYEEHRSASLAGRSGVSTPSEIELIQNTEIIISLDPALKRKLRLEVPVYFVPDGTGPKGSVFGALVGPIFPQETIDFKSDLKRFGKSNNLSRAWFKTRRMLELGFSAGSLHLEKLENFNDLFSVRVEGNGIKGARAGLVRRGQGDWHAVSIDTQHDEFYKRVKREYPYLTK
jgi:hypothetical protein